VLLSFCRTDAVFVRFTHIAVIAPFYVNSKDVLSRLWAKAAKAARFIPPRTLWVPCGLSRLKARICNISPKRCAAVEGVWT
jgi:hypothetical protein